MPTEDGCAPTPLPSQRPSAESSPDWLPSWRRSEVLDAVHPVDDVVALLRRVRLVEGSRPTGAQASVAYEAALQLVSELHELIRLTGAGQAGDE